MSIYQSETAVGWDDVPESWEQPVGDVRTYAGSHLYPTDEKPASIGLGYIPPWCVPGNTDHEPDDGPWWGPWLRMDVATWNAKHDRPMVAATVVMDPAAARALGQALIAWAAGEHTQPKNQTPGETTDD
ncbi:hypothetical protein APR04_003785 [Promicromonospora umidemergens]|uniref:Uncharacterized protein n=1 Tax=Promicromonospora umidemergens TaxID=629679 RepID=A0ABP8XFX1_9MICO|nr:hypothetical protein [Promicromonospora umidemergens]MCP2284862.1 hypothetical protein [Promicromonospora umidemergens]